MNIQFSIHNGDTYFSGPSSLTTHLMAVSHLVYRGVMDTLLASGRYEKLHLAYDGYLSLLAERDHSPGELAECLGISRQACSKVLRELQDLDLVTRRVNPVDSRSALLTLTPKGLQLLVDGLRATREIQEQFSEIIGPRQLKDMVRVLNKLCQGLGFEFPATPVLKIIDPPPGDLELMAFNQPLVKLSSHFYDSLVTSLDSKGFHGLKPAFGSVLSMIKADGGRIQYIASVVGVSKQAIVAIAGELEGLGYITREPDPADGRQVILGLTPLGEQLLNEAETSVRDLEQRVRDVLGERDYRVVEENLAQLYPGVVDRLGAYAASPTRINELSQQLLDELGAASVRALARRLMDLTRGEP